jgi:TM2 domain-containing membrane protein YozV
MMMKCPDCKKANLDSSRYCGYCGAMLPPAKTQKPIDPEVVNEEDSHRGQEKTTTNQSTTNKNYFGAQPKSKMAAGLLAIFVGSLGIHNFYLGYNDRGVTQLLLTTVGWIFFGIGPIVATIWSLIEGIQIFTGSISVDSRGDRLVD